METCACIVCDGEPMPSDQLARFVEKCALVIAADGGITQLNRIGVSPHLFIGDLDSATESDLQENSPLETIRYSSEKNESDAELAIQAAIDRKADRIILLSAGGKRPDHLYSNLSLLTQFPGKLMMVEANFAIFALNREYPGCRLRMESERTISLFTFGESVSGLNITGTKWELSDHALKPGSLGLSNQAAGEDVEIVVGSGRLLVFAECSPDDVEYFKII